MEFEQWKGFEKGEWKRQIDVRDFIQKNYTPYEGNSSFLTGTTEKTQKLWEEVLELYKKEHSSQGGVLDIDTDTISTISSHEAGYIDKDLEEIVGLQTDAPLKRAATRRKTIYNGGGQVHQRTPRLQVENNKIKNIEKNEQS